MQRNGFSQILVGVIVAVIAVGVSGYFFVSRRSATPDLHIPTPSPIKERRAAQPPPPAPPAPPRQEKNSVAPEKKLEAPKPAPPASPMPSSRPGENRTREEQAMAGHDAPASQPQSSPQPILQERAPLRSAFRQDPEVPSVSERRELPDCAGARYAVSPVDLAKIQTISPLGNLGPPGHTFPTEHLFFHISAGGETTDTIPLSSPADIRLTLISLSRDATQDPVDYTLWFALCKDVIGYYNHVKELSPELEKIVSESSCLFPNESKETRCNMQAFAPVASGALMGRVGRLQGNFDFGTFDLSKTLVFADPSRYGTRSLHIQCALDYYDGALKQRLFSLVDRTDKQCGNTAQDVPGTLKGNWFFGTSRADMGSDWDKHLGFLEDNADPGLSVISVGGTFAKAGKWEFRPQSSGFVNRSFEQVKPDGYVYCYEAAKQSGRILIEMTSPAELKIEYQEKSCSESMAFVNPTIYKR